MFGTLELLEDKLSFDGVIIGLLPTIYSREVKFISRRNEKEGVGGIESIRLGADRTATFFTAFLRAIKYKFVHNLVEGEEVKITKNVKGLYSDEIRSPNSVGYLRSNKNWAAYVHNIGKIIDWAKEHDKRLFLIQFPRRSSVYFSAEEQGLETIQDNQYYVEFNLLKEQFSRDLRIIDLFPKVRDKFVANPKKPMYFYKDAHMNEYGHEVIAEILLKYVPNLTDEDTGN